MTNWKDEDQGKHKTKKRDKDNSKKKSDSEFKKVATVAKTVGKIKVSYRRKTSGSQSGSDDIKRQESKDSSQVPPPIVESNEENAQASQKDEDINVFQEEPEKLDENSNEIQKTEPVPEVKEEVKVEVTKSEGKSKKHGKHGKSKRQQASATELKKEQTPAQVEDPQLVLKNKVFQVIKNAFSLAYTEEEELRISVDNIFPLLKALGLNPQSESVVDLVRDACMESAGDINPVDFERVVLALIKELDDDLWMSRLEEKQFLHWEAEAKKAKLEAERMRLVQERQKAGFEKQEEDVDEWEDYERQKKEEEDKKAKELKEDELYDNMKMAFRFIDADGDGVISTKDLYNLMMGVGEMLTDDELYGMVNMADTDCDGKVTFADFKRFLTGKDVEEEEKPGITVQPATDTSQDASTDQQTTDATETPAQSTNEAGKPAETPEVKPEVKPAEPELSEEEKEKQKRRRQSMLWGYTKVATKVVAAVEEIKSTEKEPEKDEIKEEDETDKSVEKTDTLGKVDEEAESPDNDETKTDNNDSVDSGNCLGAIREEDEHSNYDMDQSNSPNMKSDNKTNNLAENKRKLFSRQSSSASLKNKPHSTATDSLDDSGIDTLDTNCGSEIRDQPDVFDISDEESGRVRRRRRQRSRQQQGQDDIYTGNEDDEDMVNPRHVHESLSRVSSMESLEDELKEFAEENVTGRDNEEIPDERTRNFVEKHMYVEVEPVVDEAELLLEQEKLRRADVLQKAILRRSATTPNMTVCTSRTSRPKTARPSVNGFACSHIDIDLRCDSPPKADIKSMKKFAARIRSAKDPIQGYDRAFAGQHMSVVDLIDNVGADDNLASYRDLPKFPSRPLTRPRSPTQKRVTSARERPLHTPVPPPSADRGGVDMPERAKSAVPFMRDTPSRPVTPRRIIKRPLTAQIPYTGSRRMEKAFSKFDKNDNLTVVVSQPFLNSDELYPNKTLFTHHHHGFKSIWPIGRKINVIQNKRPFSAFEMNSYSRAIERNELPFKKDSHKTEEVIEEMVDVKPIEKEVRPKKKTLIKLELNTDGLRKPVARKITTLVRTGYTPRNVVR